MFAVMLRAVRRPRAKDGVLPNWRATAGAVARAASGRRRVLVCHGRVLTAVRDDGLAESQTGIAQLAQLCRAQLGMPLLHVAQSLIHPLDLVLALSAEHAALADGAEQLVARTVQNCLLSGGTPGQGTAVLLTLLTRQCPTSVRFRAGDPYDRTTALQYRGSAGRGQVFGVVIGGGPQHFEDAGGAAARALEVGGNVDVELAEEPHAGGIEVGAAGVGDEDIRA
jgi:hypothetical protein